MLSCNFFGWLDVICNIRFYYILLVFNLGEIIVFYRNSFYEIFENKNESVYFIIDDRINCLWI